RVVIGVASTLAALHEAGFAHGDLKPAHVRVVARGGDEATMLLDLGAAVSRARAVDHAAAYSPGFAAPEVVAGAPPSAASDLYGLGALAFTFAVGRPPTERDVRARGALRARASWVAPSTADTIASLLAHHPSDRPCGALDVLRRLGRATRDAVRAV